MNTILSTAIMQRCGLQLRPNNYFFWTVFARRRVQSHAHAPAHAQINLRVWEFVHSNKYYKDCLVRTKIVFTIIFLKKISIIFDKNLHNKNLHDNKLHWPGNTRTFSWNIIEIWIFLKYYKGCYTWIVLWIMIEISFSHVYDANSNLIFHE